MPGLALPLVPAVPPALPATSPRGRWQSNSPHLATVSSINRSQSMFRVAPRVAPVPAPPISHSSAIRKASTSLLAAGHRAWPMCDFHMAKSGMGLRGSAAYTARRDGVARASTPAFPGSAPCASQQLSRDSHDPTRLYSRRYRNLREVLCDHPCGSRPVTLHR